MATGVTHRGNSPDINGNSDVIKEELPVTSTAPQENTDNPLRVFVSVDDSDGGGDQIQFQHTEEEEGEKDASADKETRPKKPSSKSPKHSSKSIKWKLKQVTKQIM